MNKAGDSSLCHPFHHHASFPSNHSHGRVRPPLLLLLLLLLTRSSTSKASPLRLLTLLHYYYYYYYYYHYHYYTISPIWTEEKRMDRRLMSDGDE